MSFLDSFHKKYNSGNSKLEKRIHESSYDPDNDSMLKKGYVLLNPADKKMISAYDKHLRETPTSPEIILALEKIGIHVSQQPNNAIFEGPLSKIRSELVFDRHGAREYVKQDAYDRAREFYEKNN